jgi:sulfate permease, SulP family
VKSTDDAPAASTLSSDAQLSPDMTQRWRAYRHGPLVEDLLAAVVVTILLVPQSMAYALVAGLPPIVGVMASLLPVVAYAAFGSSSQLAIGPVALIAMMTAGVAASLAQTHGVSVHLAALVLTLEMALAFMLAAWLLLSAPVVHGFVTGASIAIALSQVPGLIGLPLKGNTLVELMQSMLATAHWKPHAATAAFGLAALCFLFVARGRAAAWLRRLGLSARNAMLLGRTMPVAAVAVSILLVALWPDASQGVALAGPVDLRDGIAFSPPWHAPWGVWRDALTPALLFALVAYIENLAVAEALGAKRGEKIVARRELFGLAAANAAAGLSGAMPVAGSFSRSSVNHEAGARTRMAGVWTGLFFGLTVLTLGSVLGMLPKAVLAATIIVAVLSMVDFTPFAHAWRYARGEAWIMVAVAVGAVLFGVEAALGFGVLASAAMLMQRTARPHWAEVGRLPGAADVFRNVKRFEVQTLPGVLVARVDESLLFTNTRWLVDTFVGEATRRAGVKDVVLMMSGVNDIDYTGMEGLKALNHELRTRGIGLHLSELKGPVGDRLRVVDLEAWLNGRVFRSQGEAHAFFTALRGADTDNDAHVDDHVDDRIDAYVDIHGRNRT